VKAIRIVGDFPQEETRFTSLVLDSTWLLTVTSIYPVVHVFDDQRCFMRVSFVNLAVHHEDVAKRGIRPLAMYKTSIAACASEL
jgi:hypothetical protein